MGLRNISRTRKFSLKILPTIALTFSTAGCINYSAQDYETQPVFSPPSMPPIIHPQPAKFSNIPAGGYESREITARTVWVPFGWPEEETFNEKIYHGIYFDTSGYPWDYDENGPSEPIRKGDIDNSIEKIVSEITDVSSTMNSVQIKGRESVDLAGIKFEGDTFISYTLLPNGTLDFKGDKRLTSEVNIMMKIDYEGTLKKVAPFFEP